MTIPGPLDEGFESDDELVLRDAVARVARDIRQVSSQCMFCGRPGGDCAINPCASSVRMQEQHRTERKWRVTWDEGDGVRHADYAHHYEAVRWFRSLDCDAKLEEI